MKKIKILFAVITVLTLLFTVSFASEDSVVRLDGAVYDSEAKTVTVSVYGNKEATINFGGYIILVYDGENWEIDEAPVGTDLIFANGCDGGAEYWDFGQLAFTPDTTKALNLTKDFKICDITFRYIGDGDPVGTEFYFDTEQCDMYDGDNNSVVCAGSIKVTGATADPIATEYTVGEKTYTSVPNKTFTDVAVADLSNFGGNVTVTYEGGVNTYFTKAFTFGGLGTGSGTASFDVAVVGVPSNITVTDIAVAIN